MPESSIYDYLAKDHDDATERQVLELFQASLLNAPIAVAMVELGIPGLLDDKALTGEEVAAAAGTNPDATGGSCGRGSRWGWRLSMPVAGSR
ncbi:MAG TPA: hypothetical protein VFW50_17210 [Streptosporangiaceae bacterium]|nr:hypothetical protein [Streptosporangiaceae bacterium]